MKDTLRAKLADKTWYDHLPLIMLTFRNTPKETGYSPAQLVFGAAVRLPGAFAQVVSTDSATSVDDFVSQLRATIQCYQPRTATWHGNSNATGYIDPRLRSSSHVFIRTENRTGLNPSYTGPFKVIEQCDKHFVVDKNGKHDIVSIDQLKPCIMAALMNSFDSFKQPNISVTRSG